MPNYIRGVVVLCWLASLVNTWLTGGAGFVLMTLFFGWVSLPYVVMLFSKPSSIHALLGVIAVLTFSPVAVRKVDKPALPFLMVPLASLVVLGSAYLLERRKRG